MYGSALRAEEDGGIEVGMGTEVAAEKLSGVAFLIPRTCGGDDCGVEKVVRL